MVVKAWSEREVDMVQGVGQRGTKLVQSMRCRGAELGGVWAGAALWVVYG